MSYTLNDLRCTSKIIRGARTVEETRKALRNEMGPGLKKALEVVTKLQKYLDENSKYPSLMGASQWANLKVIEDHISEAIAVQVDDDYMESANGRRRRLAKLVPVACWNVHGGRFDILVRAVQANGEMFSLAKGAWSDGGYYGDTVFDEEQKAMEESRSLYDGIQVNSDSSEEEGMPLLETLLEEPDDQPSTSKAATMQVTSTQRTASKSTTSSTITSSKEGRVKRVATRQARTPKRQRIPSEDNFDLDDDEFINLLDNDGADEIMEKNVSRKVKRKK